MTGHAVAITRGIGHAILAAASHRAPFPLRSPRGPCQRGIRTAQPKRGQIKSPSLCKREGTEGRECQYISLSPKRSLPAVLDYRGLATLCSLPRRTACPFPDGEASKEKNMSLKRIFCNKGTLTNKFVGAFITKNSCALRRSYIFFSFWRKERIMNLTLVTSYKSSSCLYQIRFQ